VIDITVFKINHAFKRPHAKEVGNPVNATDDQFCGNGEYWKLNASSLFKNRNRREGNLAKWAFP
jgi:hypothetical protein